MPDAVLFHIAVAEEWDEATAEGEYDRSTLGLSLEEVGFIHLATEDQVDGVLERFYVDEGRQLLLLSVDPGRLADPVRFEEVETGEGDEFFPHLFGPLPVRAVVEVEPIER